MRILAISLIIFLVLPYSVACADFPEAPEAPESVRQWIPDDSASFPERFFRIIKDMLPSVKSELQTAYMSGMTAFACVLFISLITPNNGVKNLSEMIGSICISLILYRNTGTMISLAADTITEITEYSKLFLPTITAAYAAQGGIVSSTGLYLGTSAGTAILTNLICRIMLPMVHFFLAAAIGHCAIGEEMMKQAKEQMKKLCTWVLKTGLSFFLTYMTITGAVSGSTDKAALKATKTAISMAVPVIGGTLAEASETLLLSAGIAKNAIGVYGIIVFLCLFLAPFFRIAVHYLVLKSTAIMCSTLGNKRLSQLVEDYCSALGLLLAMIGSECILSVIGTVCFMQGVNG